MSTEAKHTPGPWRHNKGGAVYGRDVVVCRVGDYTDKECLPFCKERWDADSALIAAAPEMLETLKHVATIAHEGGLIGMSEADAIVAIRKLSMQWFNLSRSTSESIEALNIAITKGGKP